MWPSRDSFHFSALREFCERLGSSAPDGMSRHEREGSEITPAILGTLTSNFCDIYHNSYIFFANELIETLTLFRTRGESARC
jgi:hypothetical protein